MEYFAGWNLEECLQLIPPEEVRSLIAQVAAAAKFLEDCSFAHRDIKPANIGISPDRKQAKLLDLGVIRPLDLSNITDAGAQHFFVGTLRYSPPELLFREEQQTLEGWRAITFYQLGAVLHDLLMRKQLFGDITEPYACLVRAVEREVPLVNCADGDSDLRLLAQNCLAKSPTQRLDTVKWSDFSQPRVADPMESARRKIAQHRVASAQATVESTRPEDMLDRQYFDLRTAIHSAIVNLNRTEDLPRYELQILQDFNPCLLRVIYQPSPRHGLAQVFCFFCKGAVLDPTSNHQELQVWACNAKGETVIPVTPPDAVPCFLLRGTLIEQDVRTHIQQWLFLSYAANLDLQNLTEELSWLDIGGAL
jgi:serine/threonine protein kinase